MQFKVVQYGVFVLYLMYIVLNVLCDICIVVYSYMALQNLSK